MPRIKKTTPATEAAVPGTQDEGTDDTPKVTSPATFGKSFHGGDPKSVITIDEAGPMSFFFDTPAQAMKSFRSVSARLGRARGFGGAFEMDGVYITGAAVVFAPNGESVVAEAVLVIRLANGDFEIPVSSLAHAEKRAAEAHVYLSTARTLEFEALNGHYVIARALAISARAV